MIRDAERESQEELDRKLLKASKDGDFAQILSLLVDGADPNGVDPNTFYESQYFTVYETPLFNVFSSFYEGDDVDRLRILELLSTYGADLNYHDSFGHTLLSFILIHYTNQVPHSDAWLRRAIQLGATNGVHEVLDWDLRKKRVNILQFMIEEGFDLNGRYNSKPLIVNKTLLENAVEQSLEQRVILQLLELGADPNLDHSISIAEQALQKAISTDEQDDQMYYNNVLEMLTDYRDGNQMKKEQVIVPAPQTEEYVIEQNRFIIEQDGKYGYIDKKGNVVIEPQFIDAYAFDEGIALVKLENKLYGFIDEEGQLVIEPIYAFAKPFREGLAPVKLNHDGKIQFIDQKWYGEV